MVFCEMDGIDFVEYIIVVKLLSYRSFLLFMLQAHIKVLGHLAGIDALHSVEDLPLGHHPCVSRHCIPAAGH